MASVPLTPTRSGAEQPPSYDAVQEGKCPPRCCSLSEPSGPSSITDVPPSYESLYGEFRRVQDPKSFAQLAAKALNFVVGTGNHTVSVVG